MKNGKILGVFWHAVYADKLPLNRTQPTVSEFREQIRFFVENYAPISVSEFLRICQDGNMMRSYSKPPVLLGFDDGFKNVIRNALPVLQEFKVPVVFFVIGETLKNPDFVPWYVEIKHLMRKAAKKNFVYAGTQINLIQQEGQTRLKRLFDASFKSCRSEPARQKLLANVAAVLEVNRPKSSDLDDDLRFVDRQDLVDLTPNSLITVGSHAMTHRDLATLSYDEQLKELEESDDLLRKQCPLYRPVIAYPSGSFNRDTIKAAMNIYKAGFATFLGSDHELYAYRRICLGRDSIKEVSYAVSPTRLNYILPLKRYLHRAGMRV